MRDTCLHSLDAEFIGSFFSGKYVSKFCPLLISEIVYMTIFLTDRYAFQQGLYGVIYGLGGEIYAIHCRG